MGCEEADVVMVILIVLMTALATVCAWAIRPRPEPPIQHAHPAPHGFTTANLEGAPIVDVTFESLEGALTAQVRTGEITRAQYRRAMAALAAQDDERNPLSVPPETLT